VDLEASLENIHDRAIVEVQSPLEGRAGGDTFDRLKSNDLDKPASIRFLEQNMSVHEPDRNAWGVWAITK
jgi:hypothetical protein